MIKISRTIKKTELYLGGSEFETCYVANHIFVRKIRTSSVFGLSLYSLVVKLGIGRLEMVTSRIYITDKIFTMD